MRRSISIACVLRLDVAPRPKSSGGCSNIFVDPTYRLKQIRSGQLPEKKKELDMHKLMGIVAGCAFHLLSFRGRAGNSSGTHDCHARRTGGRNIISRLPACSIFPESAEHAGVTSRWPWAFATRATRANCKSTTGPATPPASVPWSATKPQPGRSRRKSPTTSSSRVHAQPNLHIDPLPATAVGPASPSGRWKNFRTM